MKRNFITVFVIIMVIATQCISFANEMDPISSWAKEYVDKVKLDSNYSDGRLFRNYQNNISRKDFAYIGVKVYEAITGEKCVVGDASFSDTNDEWILKAKNHGIVNGVGNNKYAPDHNITREALATLFVNVLKQSGVAYTPTTTYKFVDEADFATWSKESIYIAYANGIINGVGKDKYAALGNATREQAMIMLVKMQETFVKKVVNPQAIITLNNGKQITIELYPKSAPNTVNNFITLAESEYYNGLIFHRVISGFMIQTGDPTGTGTGGPGYSIAGEFSQNGFSNNLLHTPGVLSMARATSFDSAGSQFFIVQSTAMHLNGQYAAFGKVIDGMDVVNELANVPTDSKDKPIDDQIITSLVIKRNGYEVLDVVKIPN